MAHARDWIVDAAYSVMLLPIGAVCVVARAGLHVLEGAVRVSEELHAMADGRHGNRHHIEVLQRALEEDQAYRETLLIDLKATVREMHEYREKAEQLARKRDEWTRLYQEQLEAVRQLTRERASMMREIGTQQASIAELRERLADAEKELEAKAYAKASEAFYDTLNRERS